MAQAVVKKEESAIMVVDDDILNVGTGLEDTTTDDYSVPFIRIIQSGSPQLNKNDGKYVKGSEQGHIYNTVTSECTDGDQGLIVVPCYYQKKYIEWKSRDNSGGGLVNPDHSREILSQCTKTDKNKFVLDNGNYIEETAQFYVMITNQEETEWQQAVLTMTSSQLSKARKWISQMKQRKVQNSKGELVEAPMFMFRYLVKTIGEQNDQGSWYGWSIGLDKAVSSKPFLIEASNFLKGIRSGDVKVKQPDQEGASSPISDDTVPF